MFSFVSPLLQRALVLCLHILPARGEQRVHECGDSAAPAHLPDHRGAHPDGPVLPLALPRYRAARDINHVGRILQSFLSIHIVVNVTCQANQAVLFKKNLVFEKVSAPV